MQNKESVEFKNIFAVPILVLTVHYPEVIFLNDKKKDLAISEARKRGRWH